MMEMISHVWHWLAGFTGTVALVFVIISAVLILVEAASYRSGRKNEKKKEGQQ